MTNTKQTNKIEEIKEYDYHGIKVWVKINYVLNDISIVDNQSFSAFPPKKWCFAGRGVEFMKGWQNILDAMKYAISEAEKEYLQELARVSAFKEKDIEAFTINSIKAFKEAEKKAKKKK